MQCFNTEYNNDLDQDRLLLLFFYNNRIFERIVKSALEKLVFNRQQQNI